MANNALHLGRLLIFQLLFLGRIVNMSSVNGRHALPSFSPYNASKYAVETVSDSLRMEMQRFGVKVILIEPGMFGGSTEIHSEANVSISLYLHQGPVVQNFVSLTSSLRPQLLK